MTDPIGPLQGPCVNVHETIALDEALWTKWMMRGKRQEERSAAQRMFSVQCFSIAVLIISAAMWEYGATFDYLFIKFAVTGGAILVMFQSFFSGKYVLAAAFAAVVLAFNPLIATFPVSGHWPSAVNLSAVLAFAASFRQGLVAIATA